MKAKLPAIITKPNNAATIAITKNPPDQPNITVVFFEKNCFQINKNKILCHSKQ